MKNRCITLFFNQRKGNIAAGEYAERLSIYTDRYGSKAVIPPGWTVSGFKTENIIWGKNVSLVIYRIPKEKAVTIDWNNLEEVEVLKKTYSQLVWCPVGLLYPNGTFDGKKFSEKFGRRNYCNKIFSNEEYHETPEKELLKERKSIQKNGGFYITRYHVSETSEGELRAIKEAIPKVNVDFLTAKSIATTMENNKAVISHLTYGAEYDSVLEWILRTDSRSFEEIAEDSSKIGNHENTENSCGKVVETGSKEEWSTNNIYDLAGNVDEWTQEQNGSSCRVIRGGNYRSRGEYFPVASRCYDTTSSRYSFTGFRTTLFIK